MALSISQTLDGGLGQVVVPALKLATSGSTSERTFEEALDTQSFHEQGGWQVGLIPGHIHLNLGQFH